MEHMSIQFHCKHGVLLLFRISTMACFLALCTAALLSQTATAQEGYLVFFDSDKYDITSQGFEAIEGAATQYKARPTVQTGYRVR
jgi:hypothetical protein